MTSAGANYTAQLANTTKLLDALYSLAPTWSAVDVTDISGYMPDTRVYDNYRGGAAGSTGTGSKVTNVYVDGVKIEGNDAKTMSNIFQKHKMYKEG